FGCSAGGGSKDAGSRLMRPVIDRNSTMQPTSRIRKTTRPRPAAGPLLLSARRVTPTSLGHRHELADTGEQVVLRHRRGGEVAGELVVLGRPAGALDLQRALEPPRLGVDLRRVGDQRAVAYLEVVVAADARGDLALVLGPVLPALEPLLVVRLEPGLLHRVVQREQPCLVEGLEVIELERLPRLARVRVAGGVARRLE